VSALKNLEGDELYDEYERFLVKYSKAIKTKAFYEDQNEPEDRVFFEYELLYPELGKGNFGKVFQAHDKKRNWVAIKVLHSSILFNRDMIGGFRRGIRSMKILTDSKVDGVVPLIESFEMPPTIVMQHVQGNSLEELFKDIARFSWQSKIRICAEIAEIIHSCQRLPETVFHRDLKPSNVMIEGLDWDTYEYEKLTVLDFDMSWHKNSSERDVVFETRDDFGYLAPEQTDPTQTISTRVAKVDSYGLGMTAYALFGGSHPRPSVTMGEKWHDAVLSAVRKNYSLSWKCAPYRLARTLVAATTVEQQDRLDFPVLNVRLRKLNLVSKSEELFSRYPDFIAEELLSRIAGPRFYEWNDNVDSGMLKTISGGSVEVSIDPRDESTSLAVRYADPGAIQYRNRNVILGQIKAEIDKYCEHSGIKVTRANIGHGTLDYVMVLPRVANFHDLESYCKNVSQWLDRMAKIT
jgi:serine/threonine protein kinase